MKVAALILGLIGGLLGFPSALCAGACAAGAGAVAAEADVLSTAFEGAAKAIEDPDSFDPGALSTKIENSAVDGVEDAVQMGGAVLWAGIIGSIIAIIGSCMVVGPGKKGAKFLLAGLILNVFPAMTMLPLAMAVVVLLAVATALGFTGPDREAPAATA